MLNGPPDVARNAACCTEQYIAMSAEPIAEKLPPVPRGSLERRRETRDGHFTQVPPTCANCCAAASGPRSER